ncbi:MAG: glutamate--tRNA ligase [Lachnospiraceae bacterium]|nr:glutamate--tRNA ligase [Lachnospiraceae bacterium]
MSDRVRTRFAPSPTGYMHIGNLRTALYEYLTAKHYGGDFVLRIEDTDRGRLIEGSVDVVFETMREVGLLWDEGPDVGGEYGPYVQSERMDIYKSYAEELVKKGGAYYCFCTEERLKEMREKQEASGEKDSSYDRHCRNLTEEQVNEQLSKGTPYVIRQKIPLDGETEFTDLVYGKITVDNASLDDQILIKSDGMPTYNFANVIDDHLMKISHVVRGAEYISSTPKYNLLYKAFGWDIPVYIHCPPVMKDAHNKLSKRNGDASFNDLLAQGFLPDAVLNYLLLLGWAPKDPEKEMFTLDEMIEHWDPERISASPSIFDIQKLKYFNSVYIRNMRFEDFKDKALVWVEKTTEKAADVDLLLKNLQPRLSTFGEIPEKISFIEGIGEIDPGLYINKKQKTTTESALISLQALLPLLEGIETWTTDEIFARSKEKAAELGMKPGALLYPLGIALSGTSASPGGGTDLCVILGKDPALERVRNAIMGLN